MIEGDFCYDRSDANAVDGRDTISDQKCRKRQTRLKLAKEKVLEKRSVVCLLCTGVYVHRGVLT